MLQHRARVSNVFESNE